MRDNSTETVTNFIVTAPDTSLMVEALTGNTVYNFDVVAISVFIGEQLISNVTSTKVTTPTGGEFDKFMYITEYNTKCHAKLSQRKFYVTVWLVLIYTHN